MTREMKNSGIEWIGDIPSEWKIVKVKSIFNIGRGRVIAKTELEDSGYPIYSSQTKNNGILGYIGTYDYDVDQLTWTTDGANAGTVFLRTGKYNCTNVCGTLALKNNLNCLLYMKYALEYIAIFHKRPDTNGYKIMNNEMADIKVTAPPLPEQKRIADFLDSKVTEIDKIISETKASIENYKEYKQSVITEAVTKGLDKNVVRKNCNIQWINEIPKHWSEKKILHITSMPVIDGPHVSPALYDDGIPYISADAIENGKINFDRKRGYISKEYSEECNKRYKPRENDILVVKLGASTGKMAIVGKETNFNIWVPLAVVRCKDNISPKFVFYCMTSQYFKNEIENGWTFGTQETLGVKTLEQLKICIPDSLQEQQEIVDFLDGRCVEIDYLILEKEKLITNLEEYKKSLIYEYVTGKKPV